MSARGAKHRAAQNRSGRCVMAAATSSPEFDPPKMASFAGAVRHVRMSHSAAERKSSNATCRLRPLAAWVQLGSKLGTAGDVGQSKLAAALDKASHENAELRGRGDSVTSVGGQDHRLARTCRRPPLSEQKHGYACAVRGREGHFRVA